MNETFDSAILERIKRSGIVAVVVIDRAADVVPLAKALSACRIEAIELTLRTPEAFRALRELRHHVPDMLAGVGTVLSVEQVEQSIEAGAQFGVAPGFNAKVVQAAQQAGLPFAPGVVTPSEIEAAVEIGCRVLKFFPAEPSGGIHYLRTMAAPYAHLGLQFIPLGGIKAANLAGYLYEESVAAVGGSWIAPRKIIEQRDWSTIIDHATEARRMIEELTRR